MCRATPQARISRSSCTPVSSKGEESSCERVETSMSKTKSTGRLSSWRARHMQTGAVSRYKQMMPWDATTDSGRKHIANVSAESIKVSSKPGSESSQSSIFVGGLPKVIRLDYTRLPEGGDVQPHMTIREPCSTLIGAAYRYHTRPQSAPASRSFSSQSMSFDRLNSPQCFSHAPMDAKQDFQGETVPEKSGCEYESVVREKVQRHDCKGIGDARSRTRPFSAGAIRSSIPNTSAKDARRVRSKPRPRSAGASASVAKSNKAGSHYKVEVLNPDYIWDILRTKPSSLYSALSGRERKMRDVAAKNNGMAY